MASPPSHHTQARKSSTSDPKSHKPSHKMGYPLHFVVLVILTLSLTPPFAYSSRSLTSQQVPKTTVLNVAASLQKAKSTFSSSEPKTKKRFETPRAPSSPLTLPLHSRASLRKNTHADYKSLTLSRLERDSARVNSLTSRLNLALNSMSTSDLTPFEYTSGTQSPIVSGASQGSGEYFTRIGVGQPPSPAYMVLDTGSDVSWLQCAPCAQCYQQSDPVFDPISSSTYSSLPCGSRQCKSLDLSQCRNGSCLYEVSYGDGSLTVGDFATETLTLGSTSVNNVAIGCGHTNEGLFIGAAGLLGLGGGSLSFPSQINASSFSYCLVDRDSDSASTLDFNFYFPANAVTAPLLKNPQLDTFYYLGLTGVSVAGEPLPLESSAFTIDKSGNGGIIIDSGTSVTRLQSGVYKSLRDAFVNGTKHLPSTNGIALFDTCYDLSSNYSVEVPTVSLHFPYGKVLTLPATNYLIPVDAEGTFCLAFAPTASGLSILGNVQQQGTRVAFDVARSFVGFVPDKC